MMTQINELFTDATGEARIFSFALGRKCTKALADEKRKKQKLMEQAGSSGTGTGAGADLLMNYGYC